MYDIFYTRFRKRKFDINFVYRNVALATAGLTILYFRFWIMNFEGPTFAKIDNPAAFSDHILTRVTQPVTSAMLDFIFVLFCRY